MTDARNALIVFAKRPEPGAVKTRLTTLITDKEAAELYAAFLGDSLEAYRQLGVAVRLYLASELEAEHEDSLDGLVPSDVTRHAQRGDGLGARMLNAFVETFVAGFERIAVIGTDHPTLPIAFIERAFDELVPPLATVIGPSEDGGYYLLGMNELYPQLFQGMAYSHPEVFADTLQRVHRTPASIAILPTWYDVDTPDALRRLSADLDAAAEGRSPDGQQSTRRTREVVEQLRERYALTP